MSGAQPLSFVPTLPPEESARANVYGLIARLFYAPPDEQLISELILAANGDQSAEHTAEQSALADAWHGMVEACRTAFPAALRDEHTLLFVGTGRALVTPYLSHYVVRYQSDNPLVELRSLLDGWGMGRLDGVPEYEDHVSGVCEAMRFAIAVQQRPAEDQRTLFTRFLFPGALAFCSAVSASKEARFYVHVARFALAFLDIEKTAFEMMG
jgi:TorA maturation chaperone TorD